MHSYIIEMLIASQKIGETVTANTQELTSQHNDENYPVNTGTANSIDRNYQVRRQELLSHCTAQSTNEELNRQGAVCVELLYTRCRA